jgi:hypothetical protein
MQALMSALCFGAVASPAAAPAQTLTQDEALALAFPGAEVERRTAFLDDAALSEAGRLAGPGVDVESTVVTYYVAHRGGEPVGVAYFDAHRVRTLPQVLMVVVALDDRIVRVETVSFREPPEYRAPDGWLRQFDGHALDDDLVLRRGIATMTGATLTAGAATRAARRTLALHRVIDPFAEPTP